MKNEFFSRVMHRPAREPTAALDLARDCTCLNAFALTYTSAKSISFGFLLFFLILDFCDRRKNRFPYSRAQIQKVFLKTQS